MPHPSAQPPDGSNNPGTGTVAAEQAATADHPQKSWARQDSNLRLTDYESAALTD